MEPETTETEPTQPTNENPKTELIVEQTDIDKVFSFPVFEQIENIDTNTSEMLVEMKKLNEYLIPTEEELKAMEEEQATEETASATEEPVPEEEEVPQEPVTDYQPLILEQLETLNTTMLEVSENQNQQQIITAEQTILIIVAIVGAIAVKVFVEQITKW